MQSIQIACPSPLVRRWDTFRKTDQNCVYPDAPRYPRLGSLQYREMAITSRCGQNDGSECDRNHGSGYRLSLYGTRHYLGMCCRRPIPRARNRPRTRGHAEVSCSMGRCVPPSTGQSNAHRVAAFLKTPTADRWFFWRIYLKASLSGLNRKSLFNHI